MNSVIGLLKVGKCFYFFNSKILNFLLFWYSSNFFFYFEIQKLPKISYEKSQNKLKNFNLEIKLFLIVY